jgi:hypothetical protein
MDKVATSIFMNQLVTYAAGAAREPDALNAALAKGDVEGVFSAAQAIVAAAGMMSKMLWSPSKEPTAVARGAHLRAELGVTDASILKTRNVRNSLEHLDERLDEYLATSDNILDRNISPQNGITLDGQQPQHVRRFYDGTLFVLEHNVNCPDVVAEMNAWPSAQLNGSTAKAVLASDHPARR